MTTIEVVLCSRCSGSGVNSVSEIEDYHRGIYKTSFIPCRPCNGTGRMERTTTVTLKPFNPK